MPLFGPCVGKGGDVGEGGVMVDYEGKICNRFVATKDRRVQTVAGLWRRGGGVDVRNPTVT